MAELDFIFDPTSPTFRPPASPPATHPLTGHEAAGTQLDAALDYARRGWAVLLVGQDKKPLTAHGVHDATKDERVIEGLWTSWPNALIGIATGLSSGVVVLDIDVRPSGSGFDSLDRLGISILPGAPTARTPSGGMHIFFEAPDYAVKNSASKIGPHLDVRGDGGYIIVPPGPGRSWDPIKNLDTTPLPPMPNWVVEHRASQPAPKKPRPSNTAGRLSAYGEAALDNAVRRIISAGSGEQEVTLNTEVYCIGTLVGGGEIPESLGLDAMQWAARKMTSFDAYRPWRATALETKVRKAFDDGMTNPKAAPNG
jgi:hypothetical protein